LSCLSAAGAAAQPYEHVYGPPDAADQGARRVTPVSACPDAAHGGFLAVGASLGPDAVDVLLVRTDAAGIPLWERTYDIGPGRADQGRAVAEARNGSGYVVAGWSQGPPTGLDILLMKVDCDGEPLWARTYHSAGSGPETAFDAVEARTGNPLFGTQPGDILVAGRTFNGGNNTDDSVLLRTDAGGNPIWDRRYNTSVFNETFRALTEATPSIDDQGTGDVVAAGRLRYGAIDQGYAVRADGNTGLIGGAPQGAAHYGGADAQGFESVAELRAPPFSRHLVMVGSTGTTEADIWAVRTGTFPAAPFAQRRTFSAAAPRDGREVAMDVHELTNVLPIAPLGRLALTGHAADPSASVNDDAFLLLIHPGNLAPIPAGGQLFGDHGLGREQGVSLADHPGGFIIAGSFEPPPPPPAAPDPSRDLYIVNTDGNGTTTCSRDWDVDSEPTPFPVTQIFPEAIPFLHSITQPVSSERRSTAERICQ
jgi:hypothetical protein